MATRPTAEALTGKVLERLGRSELKALVKLELRGEVPATVWLRIDGKAELVSGPSAGQHPDVIVTADPATLAALLEGRSSFSDAFVAERLALAGDMTKIVQLKRALAA